MEPSRSSSSTSPTLPMSSAAPSRQSRPSCTSRRRSSLSGVSFLQSCSCHSADPRHRNSWTSTADLQHRPQAEGQIALDARGRRVLEVDLVYHPRYRHRYCRLPVSAMRLAVLALQSLRVASQLGRVRSCFRSVNSNRRRSRQGVRPSCFSRWEPDHQLPRHPR